MKKTKEADNTMDWTQYGEASGLENVSSEDLGIPFLEIVQKGSPEFDSTHAKHSEKKIEGCKPGDLFDSLAREVIPQPIMFVPCLYQKLYVEWKPRGSGGGIAKTHSSPEILTECRRNDKNQDVLRNGNIIVTTAYFFGLKLNGTHKPAIISLTSTQLKKAKLWLNIATAIKVETPKGMITPPLFSHKYALTTGPESNVKGSWFGWKIECAGMLEDPALIADAADLKAQFTRRQALLLEGPSESGDEIPV